MSSVSFKGNKPINPMKPQLHRTALSRIVVSTKATAVFTVALLAFISTAHGQTLLFKDDFSRSPAANGWIISFGVNMSQSTNQEFVVTGTFAGPMPTNNPAATLGDAFHAIPTTGALPDNQTLEARVDLVGASQKGVQADLHFWGDPEAAGYGLFKTDDGIGLLKFWNWANSWAWFFYESRALKHTNVTLVLRLTRRGSNVEVRTTVLDKDNGNGVLFERAVTDTPQADPVLESRAVNGMLSMPDLAGTPPAVLLAPGNVALGVGWLNSQTGPRPAAQMVYDNLEVWQYQSPRPNVVAWGDNLDGQAGVPLELTNAVAVAAGGNTSLALRDDGTVVAWGRGATEFPAGLSNVVAIAAGATSASDLDFLNRGCHALALQADGTVVEWQYTCPAGCTPPPSTEVLTGLTNVVALAAGAGHSLALHADGTVTGWGDNHFGETDVPPGLTNAVAVAAGSMHSLALRRDGTVLAWGYSQYGETNVPKGLSDAVAVAGGPVGSLALHADGTVAAWGSHPSSLTSVPADLTNAIAIAAGPALLSVYGLALRADGTVLVWGPTDRPVVAGLTNTVALKNVAAIAAGSSHSLALIGDGPPITRAPMIHPTLTATGFSVSVPTQTGRVYALEYKDSLEDAEWIPLPLVGGSGHERTLPDPTAEGTQRFYRVRRW